MEQVKRRGNPNFGRKAATQQSTAFAEQPSGQTIEPEQTEDLNKIYIFQLLKTHERVKPRDGKTGEMVGSAYQPFYQVVNSGVAWDASYIPMLPNGQKKEGVKAGAARRWRYLHNYPTIWVDEQVNPEPTKTDLAAAENDIVFRNGVLMVKGYEKMKLQALMLNDGFQDCVRPLKNKPKEYILIEQEKIDKQVMADMDASFEAEKAARSATLDEMYAVGAVYGIDASKSDDAFRKDFISKARANPRSFMREFVNPKNKVKYRVLAALADNVISDTVLPNAIVYVDSGVTLLETKTPDVAEEAAVMYMAGHDKAIKLFDRLERLYREGAEPVEAE
jgi:hypothetical protein